MEYKDYYQILGVPKTATQAEIKKAYRRLARELHPDRNPGDAASEQRFKDANEAHAVLSDPEKRKRYDELGANWQAFQQAGAGGYGGFDFGDFVQRDAGEWSGSFSGTMPGGGRFTYRRVDPADLGDRGDFSDFFRTFFAGGPSDFDFGGLGQTRPGTRGGSPRTSRATRAPVAEAETEVTLAELVSGAERMVSVDGRRLQLKIPPGVSDGSRVRIPGAGIRGDGGAPSGDLFITVRVRPDPRFEQRGADLVTTVPLSLQEALLGAEVPVPTPTGSVRLRIRPGTQPGQEIRLAGRGLPRRGEGRGDLIVVARVVLPTLDERGREAFARFAREHPQPNPRGETTVH